MRINCHSHIFNFQSVFTSQTLETLINRLVELELPDFMEDAVTGEVAKIIDKGAAYADEEQLLCNIIKKELLKTGIYGKIDIYYHKGVDKKMVPHINCFNPDNYDVILNHYWHSYNHRNHSPFPHHKTIPCANGAAYKSKQWGKLFDEIVETAPAITSVSRVIIDDLNIRFNVPICHCSRGVDTDQFKP